MQLNKWRYSLRVTNVGVFLLTILLVAAYVLLWNKYRPYNVDDPWFTSFSYDLCHKHSEFDEAFGGRFPNGMGGTVVFGKLAAYPQCVFYDLFGWSQTSLQIFAKLTSLGGLILIALALLKAGFERSLVGYFFITFIAMEPFFNMANQGRYESVTFLFLGAALLLAAHGWMAMAGLISAAAVEIQPIGIVVPLTALIFILCRQGVSRQDLLRSSLRFGGGCIAFVPFYFLLHPNLKDAITKADTSGAAEQLYPLGFVYGFFFEEKYYRHMPELVVFIAAIILFIRNKDKTYNKFAIYTILVITILSLAIKWGNFNYTPFWYFPALLLVFQVAQSFRMTGWICLAFLLYVVPQYGVAYMMNRHRGFTQADITKISEQISKVAETDQRPRYIFGNYSLWFADPAHYIVSRKIMSDKARLATIVVCQDLESNPYYLNCDQIGHLTKLVPASVVDLPTGKVRLFLTETKAATQR